MAVGKSKNARTGIKTDIFYHKNCGGRLIMRTVVSAGKVKHFAKCDKCDAVGRRPRDMM